jgi:hypothetical protein
MDNKTQKIFCTLQGLESEQLKLVRRWLDELEGSNRRKAFELMNQVMDIKITNEEAFALLGGDSSTSVNSGYIGKKAG